MLIAPIAHLAEIDVADGNRLLIAWEHRMGPMLRPNGAAWCHALHQDGRPVALAMTAGLVRETCAGLTRAEAGELARLCAAAPGLNRVMLRLWREMVFPAIAARTGWVWAVSYQDAVIHSGATYRMDGWVRLGKSRSGTDARSGRKGRSKVIWGWHADPAARALRQERNAA